MCKITKLACQNSDPSFISSRSSTKILLVFTSLYFVFYRNSIYHPCGPPQASKSLFCHLFIRGAYSLVELSVLMASITCFPKAILANKKDLKRFQRAQKQFLTGIFIKIELKFVTNRLIQCRNFFF